MKRSLVVPAAGLLVLAVACGGASGTAAKTTPTGGATAPGTSAAATTGGLDTSHPFRIFTPIDRTGANAAFGASFGVGLKAATDAINADGGILGRKVVVDYGDTQSNAETATSITNNAMASSKYQAIVPASAVGSLGVVQAANRYKILLVSALGVPNMDNPKVYPTVFNVAINQAVQGRATACMAMDLHPKTVGYLYENTDPTFTSQAVGMKPVWDKYGVKVVANEAYPFTATDVTAQVQKIMQAKPDVLILGAYFNSLAAAIKAIDDLHYTGQLVGTTLVDSAPPSSFLASTTPMPKNIVSMQWAINARVGGQLSAAQQKADAAISPAIGGKYSEVLAGYLYLYDAMMYIKWGADKAGSDSTTAIVHALEGLGADPSADTGGLIAANPGFTATNHGIQSNMYSVDINGKYVTGTFPTIKDAPIANCLG